MRELRKPGPVNGRRGLAVLSALLLLVAAGCPTPLTDDSVPFLDTAGNSTFNNATALPLGGTDTLTFRGTISGPDDLDLYELGALAPGDRLLVDVQRTSGDLDAVTAVFNESEEVQAFNDDREADSSDLNPLLDFVIRDAAGDFFLGISAFSGGAATTGDYEVAVTITRNAGVPAPEAQIVYLDWDGGQNIVIPNVGAYNLPPFDASVLGPYAGRTTDMKRRVEQIVRERYDDLNLVLTSSDEGPPPAAPHSTVYFGGEDPQAFAISEQIDTFNADASDDSIVFTQSFRGSFSHTPSFEQMCQALGNTVAHEIGHLLGLLHTADCDDLMDTSCSNDRILTPQEFGTAGLDGTVFPVGVQDSVDILTWILGLGGS
jgi:hypothetical protein